MQSYEFCGAKKRPSERLFLPLAVKRAKRVERRPKDTQEAEQDDAGNGIEPTLLMINWGP